MIVVHKTLHRILRIKQYKCHLKPGVNSGALEGQTISGARRVKNPMHSHIVTSKWNRIELGFRSTYFQDMILLKSLYAFFLFELFEKTSLIINNTRFFSFIHGLQIFNPKSIA